MIEPGEYLEIVERIGRLREDGSCPIDMGTTEGDDGMVVCVAEDHAHCAGCYKAIAASKIWCSDSCSEMVKSYQKDQQSVDWSIQKRYYRGMKIVNAAFAAFRKTYGVHPERLYLSGGPTPWIFRVKEKYPALRLMRLAPSQAATHYGILYARMAHRTCLAVVKVPTQRVRKVKR